MLVVAGVVRFYQISVKAGIVRGGLIEAEIVKIAAHRPHCVMLDLKWLEG